MWGHGLTALKESHHPGSPLRGCVHQTCLWVLQGQLCKWHRAWQGTSRPGHQPALFRVCLETVLTLKRVPPQGYVVENIK